jgi:hypothetical protein
MSFQIKISSNSSKVMSRIREAPAAVRKAIAEAMNRENENTVRHTIKNRLSGVGPYPVDQHRLGFVTRKLGQSVRWTPATVSGPVIASSIGASVRYAAAHEFGLSGRVRVRSHMRDLGRQFQQGARIIGARSAARQGLLTKSGKVRKRASLVELHATRRDQVRVKAHHMRMDIPARAPIQHGIKDRLEAYGLRISKAIVGAWNAWKRGAA